MHSLHWVMTVQNRVHWLTTVQSRVHWLTAVQSRVHWLTAVHWEITQSTGLGMVGAGAVAAAGLPP
jgi:hypothetical protein